MKQKKVKKIIQVEEEGQRAAERRQRKTDIYEAKKIDEVAIQVSQERESKRRNITLHTL